MRALCLTRTTRCGTRWISPSLANDAPSEDQGSAVVVGVTNCCRCSEFAHTTHYFLKFRRDAVFQLIYAAFSSLVHYAQQGGVPHVLAPRRSRLIAAVGLDTKDNPAPVEEAEIFRAIGRRIGEAEGGWRARDLPWTPSFLPYLFRASALGRDPMRCSEGAKISPRPGR
jgi:hypothetical protein